MDPESLPLVKGRLYLPFAVSPRCLRLVATPILTSGIAFYSGSIIIYYGIYFYYSSLSLSFETSFPSKESVESFVGYYYYCLADENGFALGLNSIDSVTYFFLKLITLLH